MMHFHHPACIAGTGNTWDARGGTGAGANSKLKQRGPGAVGIAANRGGAQAGQGGALAEVSAPGAAESAAAAAAAAETAQKDSWREQLLSLTESLTGRRQKVSFFASWLGFLGAQCQGVVVRAISTLQYIKVHDDSYLCHHIS
jgi:hypothetical protein